MLRLVSHAAKKPATNITEPAMISQYRNRFAASIRFFFDNSIPTSQSVPAIGLTIAITRLSSAEAYSVTVFFGTLDRAGETILNMSVHKLPSALPTYNLPPVPISLDNCSAARGFEDVCLHLTRYPITVFL